jgi:hypothetical protein
MPLILALLLGLVLRLLFIAKAPGIHFDEAWAANYAHKIASEPGFWPINAMSPYTHPWSHYVTALFFKALGTHLWVSRLAGIAMSGAGLVLIARSLVVLGEKRAGAYFACLAAVCVPSILNERFAIEINTFHVLCLGLLIYGSVTRRWSLIALSVIAGVSSHILFLAPALAAFLVWTSAHADSKRDRVFIAMISVILFPFFGSIYLGIPEKGKALALLLIDVGVLIFVLRPFSIYPIERRIRWILLPVVGVFLLILSAMMEGDPSIAFTYGQITAPWVSIICIAFTAFGSFFLFNYAWRQIHSGQWPRHFAQWSFYTVFLVAMMSTKPAPRYFEMVFVIALIGAALTLSRMASEKLANAFVCVFVLLSVLQWGENYILPALGHEGVDQSYRYLIFHDNSSDSLSKQNLVAELGSEGCAFEQVTTSDPRLGEALSFLAIGDWTTDVGRKCPAPHIQVERAATGIPGRRFESFILR